MKPVQKPKWLTTRWNASDEIGRLRGMSREKTRLQCLQRWLEYQTELVENRILGELS